MKFVVDAQLPRRLTFQFSSFGHDAIHTLQLPLANRTPDHQILALAIDENRVVVSKDEDFAVNFWLKGPPPKLLLISTGNISNDALAKIISTNIMKIIDALTAHDFVELTASTVVVHI